MRAVAAYVPGSKIAVDATLRAAALDRGKVENSLPRKKLRGLPHTSQREAIVSAQTLRYKRFVRKSGTLYIVAVDTSGSMALNRIALAKGALVHLLKQAYVGRDRVALISFHGAGADIVMRPSGSATRAKRVLDGLKIGGATPLAAGLSRALEIARSARSSQALSIVLMVFTDGRANVPLHTNLTLVGDERRRAIEAEIEILGHALYQSQVKSYVIDTQNRFTSGGEGAKLALMLKGLYLHLSSGSSIDATFDSLVQHSKETRP